jgi:hypothetical protein
MTGWWVNAYYCLFPPSEPPSPIPSFTFFKKMCKRGGRIKTKHKTTTTTKGTKNEDRKKNGGD